MNVTWVPLCTIEPGPHEAINADVGFVCGVTHLRQFRNGDEVAGIGLIGCADEASQTMVPTIMTAATLI